MRPDRRIAERGHGLRFATGTGSLATSVGLLRLPAVDRCAAESRLLSATCLSVADFRPLGRFSVAGRGPLWAAGCDLQLGPT